MESNRDKITRAATNAVSTSGLNSLSFRQLADKVGVKSSSVHYYFPAKFDLAASLVKDYTEDFAKRLEGIDQSALSLREQMDHLVDIFEQSVEHNRLCLCGMMAAELSALNDETKTALGQFFTSLETWVCEALMRQAAHTRLTISPQQFARIVVSGLEGAMLIDRAEPSGKRLAAQRALIKALLD